MPWRVIAHADQVWHVEAVAERRPHTQAWQLVLTFRAATERPRGRSMWTLFLAERCIAAQPITGSLSRPDEAVVAGDL